MRASILATRVVLALPLALLCACTSWPGASDASDFIIVRHAEKVPDGSEDPALTAAGQARAQAIADWLADSEVAAVYSTDTLRTRQTAAPAAQSRGLSVALYDGKQPAEAFAARLRRAHPTGTVLVVAHSNTAPGIAAALCGCDVEPMDDDEYDRRMTVHIDGDGDVTLLTAPMSMPYTAALGKPLVLRTGERVALPGDASLRYVGVTADSRCPPGVQCIRAGDADVAFEFTPAGGPAVPVSANIPEAPTTRIGKWLLTLQSLEFGEAPQATVQVDPAD